MGFGLIFDDDDYTTEEYNSDEEYEVYCKKKSGNFSGPEPDCTVHSGWVRISILRIAVQKYLEIDPRRGIVSS